MPFHRPLVNFRIFRVLVVFAATCLQWLSHLRWDWMVKLLPFRCPRYMYVVSLFYSTVLNVVKVSRGGSWLQARQRCFSVSTAYVTQIPATCQNSWAKKPKETTSIEILVMVCFVRLNCSPSKHTFNKVNYVRVFQYHKNIRLTWKLISLRGNLILFIILFLQSDKLIKALKEYQAAHSESEHKQECQSKEVGNINITASR